jgi:hypothetical protein
LPGGQPAFNARRPFDLDLCYPIPNLKPFIGKMPSSFAKKSSKVSRKQSLIKRELVHESKPQNENQAEIATD